MVMFISSEQEMSSWRITSVKIGSNLSVILVPAVIDDSAPSRRAYSAWATGVREASAAGEQKRSRLPAGGGALKVSQAAPSDHASRKLAWEPSRLSFLGDRAGAPITQAGR